MRCIVCAYLEYLVPTGICLLILSLCLHLGQVLKVLSVEDKEMYALKVVNLTDQAMEEALANEVRILKKLQGHPQIVQLKEL